MVLLLSMPIINQNPSKKKEIPIGKRLDKAEKEREGLKNKYLELKKYNQLLIDENEELALENYYNERANESLLEENADLVEDVNRIHYSKYAVPCACIASAATIALGAYVALTDTSLLDYMNKWFEQEPRQMFEYRDSRKSLKE